MIKKRKSVRDGSVRFDVIVKGPHPVHLGTFNNRDDARCWAEHQAQVALDAELDQWIRRERAEG